MAKNYLRESRLSHKQARRILTSATLLSVVYTLARELLLVGSFLAVWSVFAKLPFTIEKGWNLPTSFFGVFAELSNLGTFETTPLIIRLVALVAFVVIILLVVYDIISSICTLVRAYTDVDIKLYGERYEEAQTKYVQAIKTIMLYRNYLKEVAYRDGLTRNWNKKIFTRNGYRKIFRKNKTNVEGVELSGKAAKQLDKEIKAARKEIRLERKAIRKTNKGIRKEKRKLVRNARHDKKALRKYWKSYWKDLKADAIEHAEGNPVLKKQNLRYIKVNKKERKKEFEDKLNQAYATRKEDIEKKAEEQLRPLTDRRDALIVAESEYVRGIKNIVYEADEVKSWLLALEERVRTILGADVSKHQVRLMGRSSFWALAGIKKFEKRFNRQIRAAKRGLSREQRNKIMYRRCRNVRELIFPEKDSMRSRYFMQSILDIFEFIGRIFKVDYYYNDGCNDCYKKGVSLLDSNCKKGQSMLYASFIGVSYKDYSSGTQMENYFTGYDKDTDSYEVNGYDESVRRRAKRDFTWFKRKRKGQTIYLYDRPALYHYTYNKGFNGNMRRLMSGVFLAFFVVVTAFAAKPDMTKAMDYFKQLYSLFLPLGIGVLLHFVCGCWSGTIVKIRADQDLSEWFDVTMADRVKRDVGAMHPLRSHELRTGSIIKNSRKNRAFILNKQPREHSVTLYFFRNLAQFFAMSGLMALEIVLLYKVGQGIYAQTQAGNVLAWVLVGVAVFSTVLFGIISRYVFSMNEYSVDCMEDDVRMRARKRYRRPMLALGGVGIILLVCLFLLNMMEISYLATAGVFTFLAILAWLTDCAVYHKDAPMDDYGFFMDYDDERDPSDY